MTEFLQFGHRARFLIVTLPRSGSYHLASLLGSAPDVTCLGELYKPTAIELPPDLRRRVGLAPHETAIRDADPVGYLARVMAQCDAPVFGFKEFITRLNLNGMSKHTLTSMSWQKIFLTRNPIRKYLSLQRAIETGRFTKLHPAEEVGDNVVVRFDAQLFDETVRLDRRLRHRFRMLKSRRPRRNMALDYRDLSDPAKLDRVLGFISAETKASALTSVYFRQNPLPFEDSIADFDTMVRHAREAGLDAELEDAANPLA